MSYPTKTKGYRNITVEGVPYRWRFNSGKDHSTVTLQGSEPGGQQAIIKLRGWRDPWLNFSDGTAKSVTFSPKMVRRMIQEALAAGWQPTRRAAAIHRDFETHEYLT
jgi:hypothetical protein